MAVDVLERLLGGGGELVTLVAGAGGTELADRCVELPRRHTTRWSTSSCYAAARTRYPLLVGVE